MLDMTGVSTLGVWVVIALLLVTLIGVSIVRHSSFRPHEK